MRIAKSSVNPLPAKLRLAVLDNEDRPPGLQHTDAEHFLRKQTADELLVVVENIADCKVAWPGARIIPASEYLDSESLFVERGATVINLCRGYKYLSIGYYCSLLAEARGQRAIPSVKTINDLSRKAIYSLNTSELDNTLNDILAAQDEYLMPEEFSMDIVLGITGYTPMAVLARQLYETFPAPLMRVEFEHERDWHIRAIKMQNIAALNDRQERLLAESFKSFPGKALPETGARRKPRQHIAILQNPEEALPPSNREALGKFVEAGRHLGIQVSLIEKKDFSHIAEFDALFIRETTAINHHTYLFSKKAESEGLIVMDDPLSILRCTNKVYLADLMRLNDIPTPLTFVLREDDLCDIAALENEIGYPMVMKIPDGAFSRGVSKVTSREEFLRTAADFLRNSSLILVQEYLYTEFDWRIGVLGNRPIFASQYFMSNGHWQIAKRDASGNAEFGIGRAMPLDMVPPELLKHAVKAAGLIGDGLYGVDLKMTGKGPVVIEVNDNPNIDAGIEDGVLGDELYRTILNDFVRRLESSRKHADFPGNLAQIGLDRLRADQR